MMYSKLEASFQQQSCVFVSRNNNTININDLCSNVLISIDKEVIKVKIDNEVFEFKSSERLYNKLNVLYIIYKFARFFIYVKMMINIVLKFIKK